MKSEKSEQYLKKLKFIWKRITKSSVSDYQYKVLSHILGKSVDYLTLNLNYENPETGEVGDPKILHSYLVGGICHLISLSYQNVAKESKQVTDAKMELQDCKETISRLIVQKETLNKQIEELKKDNATLNDRMDEMYSGEEVEGIRQEEETVRENLIAEYEEKIADKDAEIIKVKERCYEEKQDLAERYGNYVKNEISRIQEANSYPPPPAAPPIPVEQSEEYKELEQIKNQFESQNEELTKRVSNFEAENGEQARKIMELEEEKVGLDKRVTDLENVVTTYQKEEKELLPELQNIVYRQKYQGKSIGLEPSQIENVIRGYLEGWSYYKIYKEFEVSRTSVTKILTCDYSTQQSIEKILKALHAVNTKGNYKNEKKNRLEKLIHDYEEVLTSIAETTEQKRNRVREIESIGDYLSITKNK